MKNFQSAENFTLVAENLRQLIIEINDYPKPGISFKDITPIFHSPGLCKEMLDLMQLQYSGKGIDAVIGLESRGFLLGLPLALSLNVPFVMVRKQGKLPRETYSISYNLEYGQATIEMHRDAVKPGQRILIHDDVLATGGTASASAQLAKMAGAEVVGFSFIIELSFLNGRNALEQFSEDISTFVTY